MFAMWTSLWSNNCYYQSVFYQVILQENESDICFPWIWYTLGLLFLFSGAMLGPESLVCEECGKEFMESYLHNNFDACICDMCKWVVYIQVNLSWKTAKVALKMWPLNTGGLMTKLDYTELFFSAWSLWSSKAGGFSHQWFSRQVLHVKNIIICSWVWSCMLQLSNLILLLNPAIALHGGVSDFAFVCLSVCVCVCVCVCVRYQNI